MGVTCGCTANSSGSSKHRSNKENDTDRSTSRRSTTLWTDGVDKAGDRRITHSVGWSCIPSCAQVHVSVEKTSHKSVRQLCTPAYSRISSPCGPTMHRVSLKSIREAHRTDLKKRGELGQAAPDTSGDEDKHVTPSIESDAFDREELRVLNWHRRGHFRMDVIVRAQSKLMSTSS